MRRTQDARIAIAGVALALGTACEPPRPPTFVQRAAVRVESDPGTPLEGATVAIDGQLAATTARDGTARIEVSGIAGERHRIHIGCPDGHRATVADADLWVRREGTSSSPRFDVRCVPESRTASFDVRIDGAPHRPILHLGHEVARTDAKGRASFSLRATPGDEIELVIDTSDNAALQPQSPAMTFRMGNQDERFSLAQTFVEKKKLAPRIVVVGPRIARAL